MQTTKRQAAGFDLMSEPDNFADGVLLDACAIHAGIDVNKQADAAAAPCVNLFDGFDQRRDAHGGEFISKFANAPRPSANQRVS